MILILFSLTTFYSILVTIDLLGSIFISVTRPLQLELDFLKAFLNSTQHNGEKASEKMIYQVQNQKYYKFILQVLRNC